MDAVQDHEDPTVWQLASGVTLLGVVTGSGLTKPTYLARRSDGQVIQVSELLNTILDAAGTGRTATDIAQRVSADYGRQLTVDGLQHVIDAKLAPLGLVVDQAAPPPPPPPRAEPLLALRLRGTLVPATLVRRLSRLFAPIYHPWIVIAAVTGLIVLDLALLFTANAAAALQQTLLTPESILGLYAMLIAGAVIHELGHATACHYGGAEPGRIGFGLYLVFPAFFTDVTDSYRLNRAGRLRTDLGGLYFNVWCVLIAGIGFLASGQGMLLLLVIAMQLQMVQQLPPTLRLDGYYVLADLAGVPDLFARVGPVIRSLIPGRETDPRVAELRPGARRIVTAWVLTVIPLLVISFGWLLWTLPVIVRKTYQAVGWHLQATRNQFEDGQFAAGALSVLAAVLLVLPLLGLAMIIQRLLFAVVTITRSRVQLHRTRPRPRRAARTTPALGTGSKTFDPNSPRRQEGTTT